MRKIKLMIGAFALAGVLNAQTAYEAQQFSGTELNGTARFVGMGGAMGALGGDISTMGTNPAGIGIFRSNDFMGTFGFNTTVSESKFPGVPDVKSTSTKMSFDNMGFVYVNKIGNKTPVRYVNFGFNYRKTKNFNKSMLVDGLYGASQTDQMAHLLNRDGNPVSESALYHTDTYNFTDVAWLGALGYQAFLANPYTTNSGRDLQYYGYLPFIEDNRSVESRYRSKQSGGINTYDFNVAFNINDRIYIGATLGAYDVDYVLDSQYSEYFYGNGRAAGNYTLENRFITTGAGIDFKLGFIVRPLEESPLRIGLAFHTPTFYNLTEEQKTSLYFNDIYNEVDNAYETGVAYPYESFDRDNKPGQWTSSLTDYKLVTPWKLNASLGYTVGNSIAIGAEYEYMDYSTAKLKYDDGYSTFDLTNENYMIKSMLNAVHTIRLGVEARLVPEFAVRAGYNFSTATYKEDAYKQIFNNSVRTDTEYANLKAMNDLTLGMGYRGSMFYSDIAYKYSFYKSDFYPFDYEGLTPAKINNDRHQLLFTLGMRF